MSYNGNNGARGVGVCGAYKVGYITGSSQVCSTLFARPVPQQACMAGVNAAMNPAPDQGNTFSITMSCPAMEMPETPDNGGDMGNGTGAYFMR